jgi:hypothetical protein
MGATKDSKIRKEGGAVKFGLLYNLLHWMPNYRTRKSDIPALFPTRTIKRYSLKSRGIKVLIPLRKVNFIFYLGDRLSMILHAFGKA